ncbi:MAG: methyltransferase [Ruminiclostridium sp.]|nr:methyltransferase [Ruminiclostridium sp.]
MTSRELVYKTLNYEMPARIPRQMWVVPWAKNRYPDAVRKIRQDFPDDITVVEIENMITSEGFQKRPENNYADIYDIGDYTDVWGCKFTNRQLGIVGQIREPLVKEENWGDSDLIQLPEELLNIDTAKVNEFCGNTDKFVLAGDWARPFERLRFLRGMEEFFIDLLQKPKLMYGVMEKIHDYYCRMMEIWADTEVDALWAMDDWGTQQSLLISPALWDEIFKPMYKDYINIAHKHGKKFFMHSDGYILEILPQLVDLGLDAINCQIACMEFEKIREFRGQITFWGEIDRQHLLVDGTEEEIEDAIRAIKENLWMNGGCIAQCEFGPGARPENVYKVFETWSSMLQV